MIDKKIMIVGTIGSHLTGKTIMAQTTCKDVIVINNEEEVKQLPFPKEDTFIIKNRYPIETMTGDFVCKGKHQYRKIKTECGDIYWSCQCGRKL